MLARYDDFEAVVYQRTVHGLWRLSARWEHLHSSSCLLCFWKHDPVGNTVHLESVIHFAGVSWEYLKYPTPFWTHRIVKKGTHIIVTPNVPRLKRLRSVASIPPLDRLRKELRHASGGGSTTPRRVFYGSSRFTVRKIGVPLRGHDTYFLYQSTNRQIRPLLGIHQIQLGLRIKSMKLEMVFNDLARATRRGSIDFACTAVEGTCPNIPR